MAGNYFQARLYQSTIQTSVTGAAELTGRSQEMGFTAIWISPVVEQVSDPSRGYDGYSAIDLYGLNENFGTPSDLTALAKALHDQGMVSITDIFNIC
jgi:glycosidase